MAKTLEKIEARERLADEFSGVSRAKLIAMFKVCRSELSRSNEKLASTEDAHDKAWQVVADWKERSKKVEGDNRTLEKERDEIKKIAEKLAGQLNRCMGFIAAKMGEHPAEEAKPENTTKFDPDFDYINRGRMVDGKLLEPRRKTWREYLGLDQ